MQIDTICKIHFGNIFILKAEEIFIRKFIITTIKSLRDATISTLHHLFNTNILNNVHKLRRYLNLFKPISIGCIKSVSYLMSNQHIIYICTCFFPYGQRQNASVNIELCSFNLTMLNHEILSSKQFGKLRFDFVGNGHRSVAYGPIIQKKDALRHPSGQFFK